jgi:hypothetical protein
MERRDKRDKRSEKARGQWGHELWPVGWEESCRPHAGTRRRTFRHAPSDVHLIRHPGSKAQIASTPHDPSHPTGR